MKRKSVKAVISFLIIMTASCGEPETTVTDIVHSDGSVTRKIEMATFDNVFNISAVQVPYDSTWIISDSLEISDKGDTTYIRRAEKLFASVSDINKDYLTDSTLNKDVRRSAEFRRTFKWFNTEYRYAQIVEKTMTFGYPVTGFLNEEELAWFYSPDNITGEKLNSADSLRYRALRDTINNKTENWRMRCLVSEWIGEFSELAGSKAEGDMTFNALKAREDEFIRIINEGTEHFDSLWTNGIMLKQFIGEDNAGRYQVEADSALNIVTNHLFVDFSQYTQRIIMPGEIIGTNGFIDSAKILIWPVISDYFLTEPYIMYAESKIPNRWAWIVSGIFLLFVMAGIIFRIIKK